MHGQVPGDDACERLERLTARDLRRLAISKEPGAQETPAPAAKR
jgi:hypothetical protein